MTLRHSFGTDHSYILFKLLRDDVGKTIKRIQIRDDRHSTQTRQLLDHNWKCPPPTSQRFWFNPAPLTGMGTKPMIPWILTLVKKKETTDVTEAALAGTFDIGGHALAVHKAVRVFHIETYQNA